MSRVTDTYGDDNTTNAKTFPLITYSLPPDAAEGHYTHIESLVAFARRRGIQKSDVDRFVLDLGNADDVKKLESGSWKENWNGVWVIYSDMKDRRAVLYTNGAPDGEALEAKEFIERFAKPVITNEGLKYALVVGDCAGWAYDDNGKPGYGYSFASSASTHCADMLGRQSPVFWGCKTEVLVPIEGLGQGLVAPVPAMVDVAEPVKDDYFQQFAFRFVIEQPDVWMGCIDVPEP